MSHIKDTNIRARDSYSLDGGGRFRVSNPEVIFDSKLIEQTKDVLKWDESLVSGAGITSSTPSLTAPYTDITSTNVTAGNFVRQTFNRFNFQGGKGTQVAACGVIELSGVTVTGCIRRIGSYDDNNGHFFQSNAGTIQIGRRLNTVDTLVNQASWNLDVMDGTGPSGITADFTQLQDFFFDYGWPGRARFGLFINGIIHYVHEVLTMNVLGSPATSSPNCPVRYEMVTTASSGVCAMRCVDASVNSDGTFDDLGVVFHANSNNITTEMQNQGNIYALIGIRLKTTALGTRIRLLNLLTLIVNSGETIQWILIFNPTVAGTFTYAGVTNSAVEIATPVVGTNTNTVTGGTQVLGGFQSSGGAGQGDAVHDIPVRFIQERLGVAIDGTRDEFVLCGRPLIDNTDVDMQAGLNWLEQV